MADVIIGVVDNYGWDQIKYWANSIEQSGFDGHKALLVYNMDADTVRKLTDKGFMTVGCSAFDEEKGFVYQNNGNIMVDRFFHIYNFLKMIQDPEGVDRVIITDVRDVIFQLNPTNWLNTENSHGFDLLVGSENLRFKDEPWNVNNVTQSFGDYFTELLKDEEIYCAGVIAGELESIKDLCLNIWLVCRGLNPFVPGGGGPDQAALNILLHNDAYKVITNFSHPLDGWVLHSGTTWPAVQAGSGGIGQAYLQDKSFDVKSKYVLPIEFIFRENHADGNWNVETVDPRGNSKIVCIVHQWDRVPEWKKYFEERFGE